MTDIVTFGEVLAEFIATGHNNGLASAGLFSGPYPGGAPAIFIDQAARLGADAALVSAVGSDAFGDMLRARLSSDGVDTSAIEIRPEETTASAFVAYRADGSRDFIFNIANGACARIKAEQFDAVLENCKLFHVAGSTLFSAHMIELALLAIKKVRAAGGRISFDPNIRKAIRARPGFQKALTSILRQTDILLPSDDELTVIFDLDSEDDAMARAFEFGITEIIIKCGKNGCRYHTVEEHHDVPGFAVHEVDPTGAGDSFGATFCTLRSQGMAVGDALIYANAAGAYAVSRQGAMEGTATREELETFIAEQSKAY